MINQAELRVGDHIELLSGFPFSSDYFHESEGRRLIRIRDLVEPEGKTFYRGQFDPRWLVNSGDILIGMDGEFTIVRWRGGEALLNQRILKAEEKRRGLIDRDYFYHWCTPYLTRVHAQTAATTVKHLSIRDIENATSVFPDKAEQRQIAEILSTVDETIEQTEALLEKWQHMKAGLMHDLFTRGVTPDGHLRPTRTESPDLYQNSSLGWIPKEWEVDTIGALFARRTERGIAGLPIMSIVMSRGMVRRDSTDRRVESNLTPAAHLLVRRGDIAYNMMRMWQGVLGRAEYDGLISPAYIVMTPTPRIDSVFAEYLLSTKSSIARFKQLSYGVVDDRLRLYAHDLVRIPLAIPTSLTEQLKIAEHLKALDTSIDETRVSLAKLRQQKQGLMRDLLTGRVRVPTSEGAFTP